MKTLKNATVNVSISLPPEVRRAVQKAATDEDRSVSGMVSWLLKRHLTSTGYLPVKRQGRRAATASVS